MSSTIAGLHHAALFGRPDPRDLSSPELLDKLRSVQCSDETIKAFNKRRITGRVFMTLDDKLLRDLNITDEEEITKLRSLHALLKTCLPPPPPDNAFVAIGKGIVNAVIGIPGVWTPFPSGKPL